MTNLFIIGNWFDISHRFHTKYSDFRAYMIKKYKINIKGILYPPYPHTDKDGEEFYEDEKILFYLFLVVISFCFDIFSCCTIL